jgi:hypothetical protein
MRVKRLVQAGVLLSLAATIGGCMTPSEELVFEETSPDGRHVVSVRRLNYHATVPFVYEVRVRQKYEGGSALVYRSVDPASLTAHWRVDRRLVIEAVGGRETAFDSHECFGWMGWFHGDCVEVEVTWTEELGAGLE